MVSNSDSSAAETIGGNHDVITEILIRLPVKPLVRFKCVSKQWLSLISDAHFTHRHTHHRSSNSSLSPSAIFLRRTPSDDHFQFVSLNDTHHSKPPFTSLRFINDVIPPGSNLKILQSCNGLFLCRTFSFSNTNQNHYYYVVNPTTKHFSTLTFTDTRSRIFGVILVFEPSKSPYYQVVCVRSTAGSLYLYQIEIYSSKTRAWRISGSPFVAPFGMVFDNGVFFNGGVHWISPSDASLYFDMEKETLGKLPSLSVSERSGKRRFRYFGESGGHLHLIDIYGPRTSRFKVFEMERDYSNWFVKYEVDLDPIIATFPEMIRDFVDPFDSFSYAFLIMFLIREEKKDDDDDDSLLLHIPGKILSYNLKQKTFKKICELTPHRNQSKTSSLQFGWLDAYQYVETLACV